MLDFLISEMKQKLKYYIIIFDDSNYDNEINF